MMLRSPPSAHRPLLAFLVGAGLAASCVVKIPDLAEGEAGHAGTSGSAGTAGAGGTPVDGSTDGDRDGAVEAGADVQQDGDGAIDGDLQDVADEPPPACPASTVPAAIQTELVTPSAPVSVPEYFMGMHVGLDVPDWKPNGSEQIPLPSYGYGYTRTLKVEVGGEEERGFWSNIEIAPGEYDWTFMDTWMAANAGHPVVWLIYGTPTFYQAYPNEPSRYPSWPGIASPPTEAGHAALRAYAQAAKSRYGSQIAAFEVWNTPTVPWTGGATSFDDRWTPEWGIANSPQDPTPSFSGSASDLANIAYTLDTSALNVPILAASFENQWGDFQHSVTRFLNAPVTLPGGTGTGKNHVQGLSIQFYDDNYTPVDILAAVDGYRNKLAQAAVPNLPLWDTESAAGGNGVFVPNDSRAPVAIVRWTLLAASKALQSIILMGHVSEDDATNGLGDPVHDADVISALDEAFEINGRTICNAAVLVDGRVWVTTSDGKVFLK